MRYLLVALSLLVCGTAEAQFRPRQQPQVVCSNGQCRIVQAQPVPAYQFLPSVGNTVVYGPAVVVSEPVVQAPVKAPCICGDSCRCAPGTCPAKCAVGTPVVVTGRIVYGTPVVVSGRVSR